MIEEVQYLMRSEILDNATCDPCAELDGITLPADDPEWAGELGQLAHCNCRMMLVPLYTELPTGLEMTPQEIIDEIKQYMGKIMTQDLLDKTIISTLGIERLKAKKITFDDLIENLKPEDSVLKLLYPEYFE